MDLGNDELNAAMEANTKVGLHDRQGLTQLSQHY